MPGQVHKHQRIAEVLAAEIRAGVHERGSRLPGEHALTKRFGVSRTTLRQALHALGEEGLIATHAGIGSIVTFDGTPLDNRLGWTHALAGQATTLTTEVLRLDTVTDPVLADGLGLGEDLFLALDRVRRLDDGPGVSLERSRVPAVGDLAGVARTGLRGGSLNKTLLAHGRVAHSSEGKVTVRGLGTEDAGLLRRTPGEAFLHLSQVYRAADGSVVEQITSLLDPAHFELHVRSGPGGHP
ncbi:GntR family transcriptional regulator [Streptomyces sp. NPDC049954]|uniref:GntR family transcriptional regulator n=1 Tax=Streptomyces sp. NPDC049954 TaxID=3155779 RepID=UPI0034277D86